LNTFADLQQAIRKIDALPSMPVIAQKLLTLELNTDEGDAMLLRLIELDPLITAKIIGLANSSLFGSSGQVDSIRDAALRLGLKRVKSVAIGIATMSALTKHPEGLIKANDLWLHSIGFAFSLGAMAKVMPERLRPSEDQMFLAGLLHDIGFMVLAHLDTQASNALYSAFKAQPDRPLIDIEQELLGMTHCEIGAQLGLHWGLPQEIIATIRYHHTPDAAGSSEGQPLVNMVNIAERIHPEFYGAGHSGTEVSEQEWLKLGIDPGKIDEIRYFIADVATQANEFASAL